MGRADINVHSQNPEVDIPNVNNPNVKILNDEIPNVKILNVKIPNVKIPNAIRQKIPKTNVLFCSSKKFQNNLKISNLDVCKMVVRW